MNRWASSSLIVLVCFATVGCASGEGASKKQSAPTADQQLLSTNIAMAQRDLINFTGRFSSATADAYDQLAERVKTEKQKDAAFDRKMGNVMGAMINATDENPIVGLMDMLVMVTLVRQSTEDSWFTELFGEEGANVLAVLKMQEADAWQIGARYLTPAQLTELRQAIDRWRRDHPDQRYVALVRLTDFPEGKPGGGPASKAPGSVFGLLFLDPLSGLDPAVREVERTREAAERMFFYLQRMPLLMSWEMESAYRRMIAAPQVQAFLDDTAKFSDSTSRFADSTRGVADSVKQFPQFVTEERQRAVDQVAQKLAEQRDAAVQQVAKAVEVERDAAIRQVTEAVAAQRDAAVKQVADSVAAERSATITQATTQVSAQRDVTIEQVNSMIQSQREGLLLDVRSTTTQLLNRLFWIEITVVSAAVALTTLAIVLIRVLSKRRPV